MAPQFPMPDVAKVKQMLGLLFDGLEVKPGKKFEITPPSGSWVALYVADDGRPVAVCAVDGALAANSSAALSMLPAAAAKDALRSRVLTDVMVSNLREVMNICTRLLMSDSTAHLRLESLYSAKSLPPQVAAVLGTVQGRADFELNLPKYGLGTLAVVST
jgi:hypothetical protein